MRQVTIQFARTHLSALIDAALAGEEIVIARGTTPVAKLLVIPKKRFQIGPLKGRLADDGPDFMAPLDEDELTHWEGHA